MPRITLSHANGRSSVHELHESLIRAGRSSTNQLRLEDGAASREHFELERRDNGFLIRDLGSRNGTRINGIPLHGETMLRDGDEISVGRTVLRFSALDDQPLAFPEAPSSATMMFEAGQLSSNYLIEAESAQDERSRRDLVVLNEITRELMPISHEGTLLRLLAERVREVFEADRCAVVYRDAGSDSIDVRALATAERSAPSEVRISTTAARSVLDDRMALLITDVSSDQRFSDQQSILEASITSILCAPLETGTSIFGLVYLDSRGSFNRFDRQRLALLSALANAAAIKIDNLRLFEATLAKARMERELALAAEIQSAMLPQEAFSYPGVHSIGYNRPCYEVGGDYFDFMPIATGGFALTVADVSGKGASAALLMASCKSMLTAQMDAGVELQARVTQLNSFIKKNSTTSKFITFFQAEVIPETDRLRYVNAGHNPPILLLPNTEPQLLGATGPVLGLLDLPYRVEEVQFPPHATLVAYSDGVTESVNPDDEEYEEERLLALLQRVETRNPEALRDAILEDVAAFTAGGPAHDDVTLVIVTRS